MNFFFGIKDNDYTSTITIPKFQNNSRYNNEYKIYKASIENNEWKIERLNCLENENFYFIDEKIINNNNLFFLSKSDHIKINKKNLQEIIFPNKFTDTHPAFRASLEILKKGGGFSSYQSEYPYGMINKKSKLLSPIGTLLDKNAEKNFLIFRNIFYMPEHNTFSLFIIDIDQMKILNEFKCITNKTNVISIEKTFINQNTYIFSDTFLGIPIFLSEKNGHMSLEHTHPLYHYILGETNFQIANKLKNKIYEKIFEKNTTI